MNVSKLTKTIEIGLLVVLTGIVVVDLYNGKVDVMTIVALIGQLKYLNLLFRPVQ